MRNAIAVLCLTLVVAACSQTPKMEESPGPEPDRFFSLALEPGPVPLPADGSRLVLTDAQAVELRFRFLSDEILLTSPVLTVRVGEQSEIRVVNQMSYVSDFDIEVAQDAFIADPVISILDNGLTLRTVAVPTEDGRSIALAWRLRLSRLETPIRAREVRIGPEPAEPVVIQFPAVRAAEASGRTLLDLGVETSLVRMVGEKPITVFVSAVPVDLPADAGPNDTFELLPEAERPEAPAEPEPDALLDRAAERDPPARGRRLGIMIGTWKGPALTRPLHLDAVAGAIFMSGVDVLRHTSAAAAAEPGASVSYLLETSYHRDSKPHETGIRDPEVDTASIGFTGRFDVRDDETVLEFQFSAMTEIREVTRKRDGVEFPVERPMEVIRRGVLRLRGVVDVMPMGTLEDGGNVVLVVRRDVPR